MGDDDDRETAREEYLFGLLQEVMKDARTRQKIFLKLCAVPLAANQVDMLIRFIDERLNPKLSTKPEAK